MNDDIRAKIWENSISNREILLNCDIDDKVIEFVVKQIIDINADDEENEATIKDYPRKEMPIKLFINSSGGNLHETLSVVSAIESSKTPVWTYALGQAMSGGFLIAISGHKRFAQKYTTLMWHQANGGIRGENQKMKEYVSETDRLMRMADDIVKSRSKITQEHLDEIYKAKIDWCIGAKEAKKLGVIDEIF